MGAKKVRGLTAQFALQMQCAKNAGIYDRCFLAFGSLLGYVREGGFIGHDNDMDIGILADNLTVKQINAYVAELLRPSKIDKDVVKLLKTLDMEGYLRKDGKP
ncbi:MAG: LicD family protein, partial [Candidatus Omnitrophica bacterium]|nr:LicD family protein [Candidatus Omnitrophota bacterium]